MAKWTLRPEGCESGKPYNYTPDDKEWLISLSLYALSISRVTGHYLANGSYDYENDRLCIPVSAFSVLEMLIEPISAFLQEENPWEVLA